MSDQHINDPMPLERSLRMWLGEGRPPMADREARINEVLDALDDTPQARRRYLGRWLQRDEGAGRRTTDHDHPPNSYRRNRLMLSATGLTIALALLAVSSNVIDDQDPTDRTGAVHFVAADGSGDFSSIQAAVDAAVDGDTIVIGPGTYEEAILIDKDLAVRGQGARREVVISHSDGRTPVVTLRDSEATLSAVTLTGRDSQVLISGGAPTIEDVMFDAIGVTEYLHVDPFKMSLELTDGARATVKDSAFVGGGEIRISDASPLIESNLLLGGPGINLESFGADTVVRGNEIRKPAYNGILLKSGGSVTLEDNDIADAGNGGIVAHVTDPGFAPTIRRNTISNSRFGIQLSARSAGVVTENILRDNDIGLAVRSGITVVGNAIEGDGVGIMAVSGAPMISDNVIDVTGNGVIVRAGTSPSIHGNRICTPGMAIQIADGATPDIGQNQSCE